MRTPLLRSAVLDRANGRCEGRAVPSCTRQAEEVHHRLPRSRSRVGRSHPFDEVLEGELELGHALDGRAAYLLALCRPCHDHAHRSGEGYADGLLVRGSARIGLLDDATLVPFYRGPDPDLAELWPPPSA